MIEKLIQVCKGMKNPRSTTLFLNPKLYKELKESVKDSSIYRKEPLTRWEYIFKVRIQKSHGLKYNIVLKFSHIKSLMYIKEINLNN